MSQAQNTIAATIAANATAADNAAATVAATAAQLGRRALEAQNFASGKGERAGQRFVNIALHIAAALETSKPGEKVRIRYESINSATGQKRGANASNEKTKIGVWRTGIAQARNYAPDTMAAAALVEFDATGMLITAA